MAGTFLNHLSLTAMQTPVIPAKAGIQSLQAFGNSIGQQAAVSTYTKSAAQNDPSTFRLCAAPVGMLAISLLSLPEIFSAIKAKLRTKRSKAIDEDMEIMRLIPLYLKSPSENEEGRKVMLSELSKLSGPRLGALPCMLCQEIEHEGLEKIDPAHLKNNLISLFNWGIPQLNLSVFETSNIINWYEPNWYLAVAMSVHGSFTDTLVKDFFEIPRANQHWDVAYLEILLEVIALTVPKNMEEKKQIVNTLKQVSSLNTDGRPTDSRLVRLANYLLRTNQLRDIDPDYTAQKGVDGLHSVQDHQIFLSYVFRRLEKGNDYGPPPELLWGGKVVEEKR